MAEQSKPGKKLPDTKELTVGVSVRDVLAAMEAAMRADGGKNRLVWVRVQGGDGKEIFEPVTGFTAAQDSGKFVLLAKVAE